MTLCEGEYEKGCVSKPQIIITQPLKFAEHFLTFNIK